MKRVPVVPTLIVAAAVAVMIALGVWQIQRAEWKAGLIQEIEASRAFRPKTFACTIDAKPEVRAGRDRAGRTGYRYLVPCTQSETPVNGPSNIRTMTLDIGWSQRPDALGHVRLSRAFTGIRDAAAAAPLQMMVLDEPLPPLAPSGLPSAAELPNNHMLYAIQWFFFALAAAVIYILALRRRQRP